MSDYPVESDVPQPPRQRVRKYPWHELEVGQSFCVPPSDEVGVKNIRQSVYYANRTFNPKKFSHRPDGDGGVRVRRDA